MNFISIGGWCGTKIALKDSGLFNEPSLPFDSVRTSIEGIIDCIENDFTIPDYYVHSANPVGKENIEQCLENSKKVLSYE